MSKTCYSCKFCSKYTAQEMICAKGVENYTIEDSRRYIDCDEYEYDDSMVKCKDCMFGGMILGTNKANEVPKGICFGGFEIYFRNDYPDIERKCNGFKRRKTCANCNWCHRDELEDMICVNGDSEYTSDYVYKNHSCDEWEGTDEDY